MPGRCCGAVCDRVADELAARSTAVPGIGAAAARVKSAAERSRVAMSHPPPPSSAGPASPAAAAPAAAAADQGRPLRPFGRYPLLRLLGKSQRTMVWLVVDTDSSQRLLAMPRHKPDGPVALAQWLDSARRAARLRHPGLAPALEASQQQGWPFVAYDGNAVVLLSDRIGRDGLAPAELVPVALQALQGLAFAHEAGVVHHDLNAGMLLLSDGGGGRLIGLGAAAAASGTALAQRLAAERDVLAFGLVLHHALTGTPALGQADAMQAVERMPPVGRDAVRLTAQTVPEPLRAIVNRATERQPRHRYRNARTLERALSGWIRTSEGPGAGPMALLLDRLRSVGLLPAMPGGAARAEGLLRLDRERTSALADIVLEDPGLSLELLRQVNSAGVRAAMPAGSAPILTVRRAIVMLGLDAVQRSARQLKPWPGPLDEAGAAALNRQFELARRAGRAARWLRPAGYDAELVHLLAMLQRLGMLLVHYHFPDEALQIQRLMQSAPSTLPGQPDEPGMGEQAASFAVLGFDIEALGQAVGRHCGLDDAALQMMRRLPLHLPVHPSVHDADLLRCSASCANELIDSQSLPAADRAVALHRLAQRYARTLHLSAAELQDAAAGIEPAGRAEAGESAPVEGGAEPGLAARLRG